MFNIATFLKIFVANSYFSSLENQFGAHRKNMLKKQHVKMDQMKENKFQVFLDL